jgi:hypothetical protein
MCWWGCLYAPLPGKFYSCAEKEYCTWRTDPDWAFDCVFTKTNPVPAAEEHVPSAILQCPPQESNTLMLIHNPDDCSTYYGCNNGIPVLFSCTISLYQWDVLLVCISVQNGSSFHGVRIGCAHFNVSALHVQPLNQLQPLNQYVLHRLVTKSHI